MLQLIAQHMADRVGNITIAPIRHAARGHGEEQAVVPIDDFDVVNGEYAVERNRDKCLELSVFFHMAEFKSEAKRS